MSSLIGTTLLDRYFLRESAGSGGMADVYLAWDKLRSTKLAIKVLRRDLANDPRFFQMFAKEAELLRKLEHPNIVRLYEFDKQGDIAFIVMDWIDGTNLRQAIASRKSPFSLEEVSYVLLPVCSALNCAHQKRVVHCDVKPANILLHNDGRILLTDLGFARLAAEDIGGGTPPYMSPEQFSGEEVTAQSDIYSLGITIFEMLSGGQVPFRGDNASSWRTTPRDRIAWEHMNLPLPSIRSNNPNVPESVEQVINTALCKEPQGRYSSSMALREAYEHAVAGSGRGENVSQNIVQLIPPKKPHVTEKPAIPQIKPPSAEQFKRFVKSINIPKPKLKKSTLFTSIPTHQAPT